MNFAFLLSNLWNLTTGIPNNILIPGPLNKILGQLIFQMLLPSRFWMFFNIEILSKHYFSDAAIFCFLDVFYYIEFLGKHDSHRRTQDIFKGRVYIETWGGGRFLFLVFSTFSEIGGLGPPPLGYIRP